MIYCPNDILKIVKNIICFLILEEARATGELLSDAQKAATDIEKAKRKVETEREEAYNALEVS